jgi:protein required for attachment to host cells
MALKRTTWLLVGDGSTAQLYSVNAVPLRITKVQAALKATRRTTHGPEHHRQPRHVTHVGNQQGDHQRHEDVFVERIAAALEDAATADKFDQLIVVLPPKALAHFRKIVGSATQKRIKQEIRSEWTRLAKPDIEKHLAARLP